jgi:putative endonuclease
MERADYWRAPTSQLIWEAVANLSMAGLDPATQFFATCGMPQGHVYILASKRNGTLYTGVTNNLAARIYAHREGRGSAFTKKYNVKILVWYESYDMVVDAIQRETSIKRWPRKWKLDLIEKENPDWNDLYETLG